VPTGVIGDSAAYALPGDHASRVEVAGEEAFEFIAHNE
jgi:hypothetical protein